MSSLLTAKQRQELNLAIVSYLSAAGHLKAAAALREELNLDVNEGGELGVGGGPGVGVAGLLEKKWTSVIRLQKKVLDLETKVAQLTEEISAGPGKRQGHGGAGPNDWLPRPPEKHQLQGHRSPVTRVAFHPVYTVLASASEDSTIKTWVSTWSD